MSRERDQLLVIVGTVIFTVGILSVCVHFASMLKRERILLWFGLFAAPYGCALLLRSLLFPVSDHRIQLSLVVFGKLIGFASGIPAVLLFREFYGKGWHLSSQWILWTYSAAVAVVLMMMALHEPARTIPPPGIALVLIVPLVVLFDRFAGYRPPVIPDQGFMFSGLLVFFLAFSYDHLVNFKQGVIHFRWEPFGFLILIACLGRVVARRVAMNDAEWISLTGEMKAAQRIQEIILPAAMPLLGDWTIAARYSPMSSVAGDFYGFPSAAPDSLNIVLADAMGHGVPAALIASMIKVSVFIGAEKQETAATILGDLNATLCSDAPGQLASAAYVLLDRNSRTGRYASAGHPPPFLRRRRIRPVDRLNGSGLLLGVRKGETYQERLFRFDPGDRLLLYSDGLTDTENPAGISFGDAVLPDILERSDDITAEELASVLLQEVFRWTGKGPDPSQTDDITFVIVDFGR